MHTLAVVVGSTRDGRAGAPIAEWFDGIARKHGAFDVTLLDLRAIDLPLLREPEHPRLQKYRDAPTVDWSRRIAAADAFVFVTPEYNFRPSPALVNALDHLYVEWNYKAAGFVSYGGVSGGLRSVQMTKQIATTLKMVPLVEAVAIPFYTQFLDKATLRFDPGETHEKSATTMLNELVRWTDALKVLRPPAPREQ
jgi:NAD(P)H-dependent FMN reductase